MKYFKLNDMKCKCGNEEFFFRHKKNAHWCVLFKMW